MPPPKQEVYEGRVVPTDKWDRPNTFNMTGDKYIRVRNIDLRYVESIKYISGSGRAAPTGFRAFKVVSKAKGNTYLVGVMNGKFKCNCVGFEYRKHCKHVAEVAKRIGK
jgi:hypothetical protein